MNIRVHVWVVGVLLAVSATLQCDRLDLSKMYFYDTQTGQYECVKEHPDVLCRADRGMAMVFPLSPERAHGRVIEIFPAFFPPSNARLDDNFADYIEFLTETLRQWDLKQKGEIRGVGGILIDGQPRRVFFVISNEKARKWRGQKWLIELERHGRVEMLVSLGKGDVNIHYRRLMEDGSFTESSYSYRADAKCPPVIVLDPSHSPK